MQSQAPRQAYILVPNTRAVVFVRIKWIKDKPYAYLVENKWKNGTSRQTVKEYLGRVHCVDEQPTPAFKSDATDVIPALIAAELENHDQDVRVDLKRRTVEIGGKQQVLALNGGYLCTRTLKDIYNALHTRNEEQPGTALAESFSRAGLRIPPEAFIVLYQRHQ